MKLNEYFNTEVSILKESTEELKHVESYTEQENRKGSLRRFRSMAKENFMKAIVIEMAFEALPLSEEKEHYKESIKETMGNVYDSYIAEGAFDKSTETKYLIEAVADYLVEAKSEKIIDNGIEAEYVKELDKEDDLSVKNAAGDINTKNITETIKSKVIKSVEKEQEMAESRKAELDELNEADKKPEDEESAPVEEATLLKSIMIGKGKEAIREGLEGHDVISEALVDITIMETMHTLKIMKDVHIKTIKESYIF